MPKTDFVLCLLGSQQGEASWRCFGHRLSVFVPHPSAGGNLPRQPRSRLTASCARQWGIKWRQGERHMLNTKCDTARAGFMGPGVEEMVTMVGPGLCLGPARHLRAHGAVPCGRGGPGSGAGHGAVRLRRASLSLLPQQAKHQGLAGSLKLPVGLRHQDGAGGGVAQWPGRKSQGDLKGQHL